MIKIILLLTLATMASAGCDCGRRLKERIINGREVTSNAKYPWMVRLQIKSGEGYSLCGGSIISANWILTAAHCTKGATEITVFYGKVEKDLNQQDYFTNQVTGKKIIIHPEYDDVKIINDISLIELTKPLVYSKFTQPICLPKSSAVTKYPGFLTAAGWGRISDSNRVTAKVLQETDLRESDVCFKYANMNTKYHLCTSGSDNTATCQGDSGGPLMYKSDDEQYTVVGLVSFGAQSCVDPSFGTAFCRVSSYVDWIRKFVPECK